MVRARRVKTQRALVSRQMPAWPGGPLLHVRLTRVAPRPLDSDNCAAAMKSFRDACASRLRIDDASPLVEWHYAQAKGDPEVVVQIWAKGEDAPPVPTSTVLVPSVGIRQALAKTKRMPQAPPMTHPGDGRPVLARMKGRARVSEVLRRLVAGEPVYGNAPPGDWTPDGVAKFNAPIGVSTHKPSPAYFPSRPHVKMCPWPVGGACTCDPQHADFVPRSKSIDAAREAEATFAPPNHARDVLGYCVCGAGPEEGC